MRFSDFLIVNKSNEKIFNIKMDLLTGIVMWIHTPLKIVPNKRSFYLSIQKQQLPAVLGN